MSGMHTCRDVYCVTCDTAVGWEYVRAFEKTQKYKVSYAIKSHPTTTTATVMC